MKGELKIADFLFAPKLNELRSPGGESVHMEPRTTAVLAELVEHAGEVRSRDELLTAVWGDAFVGEAALTHCIWELRRAFGDDARQPRFIQTVPRRGYRLLAKVSRDDTASATLWLAELDMQALGTRASDSPGRAMKRHRGMVAELLLDAAAQSLEVSDQRTFLHFENPGTAVAFALSYHAALEELSRELTIQLASRVAVHVGQIEWPQAAEASDATEASRVAARASGPAVTLISRLVAVAQVRQTVLTRGVFDIARRATGETTDESTQGELTGTELRWLAHGSFSLTGIEEPVELFEVADAQSPVLAAPASDLRVVGDETIVGWRPAPGLAVPKRPHWRLMEKLGEGGFGEVWLSRHEKTGDRRVFKFCFEAERLRALQREVTLFRLLKETLGERDDIAHLLDWSFDEAPYFLEMEHTVGGSLVAWIESCGGLAAIPREVLLELMAQAADALAAAHSVGVLHKDVKPENMLVHLNHEEQPWIRLADFGIGSILQPERLVEAGITVLGLTRHGDATEDRLSSGTRLYMAPELLEGRVASVQADVYALGVVLYQVAVGEFDRAVATGWQRNVDDDLLAEDIAAMVDVSPANRPPAGQVAEWLRQLPQRRAERLQARLQQEQAVADRQALASVRRKRRLWSGVAAAMAMGLLLASIFAYQAWAARGQAEAARQRAEDLVTFMLGDLRKTLDEVGRLDAMDAATDEVLAYYESMAAEDLTAEDLARHGEALRQIGQVRLEQGNLDEAAAAFDRGAGLAKNLTEREPATAQWLAQYADSRFWLGYVARQRGDLDAALAAFEEHRAAYQELVSLELVSKGPETKKWGLELAYGHGNVGTVLQQLGDLATARQHFESRRDLFVDLLGRHPEDRQLRLGLATSHDQLGRVLQSAGDLRSAMASFQASVEMGRALVEEAPTASDRRERLAVAEGMLGWTLWNLGKAESAGQRLRAEVAGFENLTQLDSSNYPWQRNLAVARCKLARVLIFLGDVNAGLAMASAAEEGLAELIRHDAKQFDWRHWHARSVLLSALGKWRKGETAAALASARHALVELEEKQAGEPGSRENEFFLAEARVLYARLLETTSANQDGQRIEGAWRQAVNEIGEESLGASLGRIDLRARALVGAGNPTAAQPLLEQLAAAGYRNPELLSFLGERGLSY